MPKDDKNYPGGTAAGVELPYDHPRKRSVVKEPPVEVGGNLKMKKIRELFKDALSEGVKSSVDESGGVKSVDESRIDKVSEVDSDTILELADKYLDEMCGKDHGKEKVEETENELDSEPKEEPEEEFVAVKKDIAEMKGMLIKLTEESEYRAFFNSVLKKFGVNSPAELDGTKKKEFFDYVEKHWTKEKN